ncbi:MAG: ATP-binding protein [Clostridiales bacterium]|jgi:hypothetical protein|nr:ATP-binding protein [Clostridiales bacterium]
MLLQFEVENYKTFRKEAVFSMIADPCQEGVDLDYSLIHRVIEGEEWRIQCSSIIVGPNASGKTNLFSAMDTLRAIVLRGNILNAPDSASPNKAAHTLELIPNAHEPHKPVSFLIAFIEGEALLEYALQIDLGPFMASDYDRKVLIEELSLNNKRVFKREGGNVAFGELEGMSEWLNPNFSPDIVEYACLEDTELFLSSAFKTFCSVKLAKLIRSWFELKLIVAFDDNVPLPDSKLANYCMERTLKEGVSLFGARNPIAYAQEKSGKRLMSKVGELLVPAAAYESAGVHSFLNIFPALLYAYAIGATLMIDGFPFNLHTDGVLSIINLFHNDDYNVKGSQLVFSTHNLILLNRRMFRRDEIKFIDIDDKGSDLYSISDFEISERDKMYEYDKNYIYGLYGAIKDVEFESVFSDLNE